ncbi:hypothetical protein PGT21_002541 [Puccinia graminis f. sp. tritici]|uniref:Uncharacterized protein n=1 Tax=Puccinia graminis f. sp. tritici TaxID=56615 RepID=A0A5B0NNU5_PUCGR|nr:hypothetical protein PGT21_002541 [Puccinia graminis f. sp. tritici]KAA1090216.1 hypothetical protein PGTUg99_037249 [Puccinia graminis f. sp. tritici]
MPSADSRSTLRALLALRDWASRRSLVRDSDSGMRSLVRDSDSLGDEVLGTGF